MVKDAVIVVGAGLAGLAAADWLIRRRVPVTLFEGRDRIGGRVWTLRDGFVGNLHAEAGGEFIDEGQDAIRELVQSLGLRLLRVLRTGFGLARRSPRGRVEIHRTVPWHSYLEELRPILEPYVRGDQRWDGPVARAIARRSIAEFVRTIPGAAKDGLAWLQGLLGADVEDLSLLVLAELAATAGHRPGRQKLYRIVGGADRLVDRLAAPLRNRIHLRRRVVAVSQTSRAVRIKVRGADGALEEITGGHVILTAPAATLKEVAFHPRIPEDQWKAIVRLRYGQATKTHLQFDRAFWRRPGRPSAFGTTLPIGAVWDGTEGQVRGRHSALLTLLAGGSASDATRAILSRGGPERLRRELKWLGAGRGRLLSWRSVTWETDPWSRGSYAYFDPAYDPSWRLLLARPFGRILFAGEHTSLEWQGYMNGAVESGQRAAAEVLALTKQRGGGPISVDLAAPAS